MKKFKIYSKLSPVISRGRGADKVLVAFHMKATWLSTAKEKGGETPIAKEDASDYRRPLTTMVSINTGLRIHKHKFSPAQGMTNIGKQDITLDEEMMAEYNCQIETTTVCQSYGLDIDEDAANIRDIREVTDTKMGTFYSNVRAMGLSTMYAKEGNDLSSRDMTPIRSSRVSKIRDINPKNIRGHPPLGAFL